MNLREETKKFHLKYKGKIGTLVLTPVKNRKDLSLAYTPGVGEISKIVAQDKNKIYDYTLKGHTVAVISDGSAVLGLGNIGPEGALPVMEGKALLFKTFANLDAFPICLATQETNEIISIVKALSPSFGAINLEDISAPRCFEIEEKLQNLGIPVMHDDQHGTSVVVLAGLINAAKVAHRKLSDLKVVISGAGAAGQAITRFLEDKVKEIIVLDSQGVIFTRRENLDIYKKQIAQITNKNKFEGGLKEALVKADVFIGVSKAGLFLPEYLKLMNTKPIIFALANPNPEIMPEEALKAGAFIVATGRSDFNNQVNNSLAFPGIFKGALKGKATKITKEMKLSASLAIAKMVKNPTRKEIIPDPFTPNLTENVAKAVAKAIKN